ncbi:hypothetical protein MJH12_06695, partial [bacterium]|nr:hypothetical protein [bacterium]
PALKEFWKLVSQIDRFFDQSYNTEQQYDAYVKVRQKWTPLLDQLSIMYMTADHESWSNLENKELYQIQDGWINNDISLGKDASIILTGMYKILEEDHFEDPKTKSQRDQTMISIEKLFEKGLVTNKARKFTCYQLKSCINEFKVILLDLSKAAHAYMK